MVGQDPEMTFGARDEFGRESVAQRLTRLLLSDVDASPILIDGPWGSGKTEFCHKMANLIESKETPEGDDGGDLKVKCYYVDAFKADHMGDPFATVLSVVVDGIENEKKKSDVIKKAAPLVKAVFAEGFRAAVKGLTTVDVADITERVGRHPEDDREVIVSKILNDHARVEERMRLLSEAISESTEDGRSIVIIDELDRCRPDFSMDMLETVKHIFDVKGVSFVIVANVDQLVKFVIHRYGGDEASAEEYLEKFSGFRFSLLNKMEEGARGEVGVQQVHLRGMLQSNDALSRALLAHGSMHDLLCEIAEQKSMSLRAVERWVRYIEVYSQVFPEGLPENILPGWGMLVVYGAYLSCFNRRLADDFIDSSVKFTDVMKSVGVERFSDISREHPNASEHLCSLFKGESVDDVDFTSITDGDAVPGGPEWKEAQGWLFQGGRAMPSPVTTVRAVIKALRMQPEPRLR